jgi:hypothetical protein
MTEIDDKNTPHPNAPLAGGGGVLNTGHSERDPYEAFDDLMSVVEAFCPTWPQRKVLAGKDKFLL